MGKTKISWTDYSWNPVTGCTKVSPGCTNCYAEKMARRLAGRAGYPEAPNHFDVTLRSGRLDQPLRWKKPGRVFVCSMGDLFHKEVPGYFQDCVMGTIAKTPQHTYQILTKRPSEMLEFVRETEDQQYDRRDRLFPNVWLGVSVENQQAADERIPILLQTPAAVRFVSVEPMLEKIDLAQYLHCGIGWCIIGAESGSGRRPMKEEWVRGLVVQCKQANVPVFYKQAYENGKRVLLPQMDGKQYAEYPQTINRQNEN